VHLNAEKYLGVLTDMSSYVRFYAYIASMITVDVVVHDLAIDSAFHKDLHSINHERQNRGVSNAGI